MVDAALANKLSALNVWGPQLYHLEQKGFRRILPTTFIMAFMFTKETNTEDAEKYIRALLGAQTDIGSEPENTKDSF